VSPFEEAAIISADGVGEWTTTAWGVGRGTAIDFHKEIRFPHSVGLLFSAITAYLGFRVNDPCDGHIICASPKAGKVAPDKVACGETVAEGTVAVWHKKVGDTIAVDELLFDVETDKVSMEVQAITSGVLSEIRVQAGETVPVGAVVAVIGDGSAAGAPTSSRWMPRRSKAATASSRSTA